MPGKPHGGRSLVGCSPWGRKESYTTEQLHFHFSLSCLGEGNGNPLQYSCLENPRDRGAWWAAICGVAQSRTRLKRLSSGSSCFVTRIGFFTHIYEETLSAKYSAECCSGGGEKETRVNHFSRRENVYEFPLFSSRHIQKSSLTPTCCCC